jgi:hypothetical protein
MKTGNAVNKSFKFRFSKMCKTLGRIRIWIQIDIKKWNVGSGSGSALKWKVGSGSGSASTKTVAELDLYLLVKKCNTFITRPQRRTSKPQKSLQPSKENI